MLAALMHPVTAVAAAAELVLAFCHRHTHTHVCMCKVHTLGVGDIDTSALRGAYMRT